MKFSSQLISILQNAHSVGVLTGAGISAESGIPTFRDQGGLWQQVKPEEMANFEAFLNNPNLVQKWYQHRREIIFNSQPNAGHLALVDMENLFSKFNIITQNIDNLHQRAGSKNVIELHGNINRNYCSRCLAPAPEPVCEKPETLRCQHCGAPIRPDIVWFGEMLPPESLEDAINVCRTAEVFFSIGTSSLVHPAARLPLLAQEYGAYTVEVNPERTSITGFMDESLIGQAGVILPELLKHLKR